MLRRRVEDVLALRAGRHAVRLERSRGQDERARRLAARSGVPARHREDAAVGDADEVALERLGGGRRPGVDEQGLDDTVFRVGAADEAAAVVVDDVDARIEPPGPRDWRRSHSRSHRRQNGPLIVPMDPRHTAALTLLYHHHDQVSAGKRGLPVRATRSIAATNCRAIPGSWELCPASSTM